MLKEKGLHLGLEMGTDQKVLVHFMVCGIATNIHKLCNETNCFDAKVHALAEGMYICVFPLDICFSYPTAAAGGGESEKQISNENWPVISPCFSAWSYIVQIYHCKAVALLACHSRRQCCYRAVVFSKVHFFRYNH